MNRDNAHLYLPLVQALADGRTIEIFNSFTGEWEPDIYTMFAGDIKDYRIKPEPKTAWYRVADTDFGPCTVNSDLTERLAGGSGFKRWLTERVTYEVTE